MRNAVCAIHVDDMRGVSERSGREVRFAFGPWAEPRRWAAEDAQAETDAETEENTDA